jgi:hypothetical protein
MPTELALPMMVERGGEFRWRVQSSDGTRRSASWRIWTAKNSPDVYVAQRQLAGKMKISLHADGNSHAGFTSNEISKSWQGEVPGGSRHLDKWRRPSEFAPGWTNLYEIVHPEAELRSFEESGLEGKTLVNFPVGEGYAIHVYVLGARFPIADLTFSDGKHAATLVVDDDKRVAVVAILQPWTAGAQLLAESRARDERSTPANFTPPNQVIDKDSPSARFTVHGTHADGGGRFVIDAAGSPLSAA